MSERAQLLARIERWIAHFGEPMGAGRANPDNDLIYLLRDCGEALRAAARFIEEDRNGIFRAYEIHGSVSADAEPEAAALIGELDAWLLTVGEAAP